MLRAWLIPYLLKKLPKFVGGKLWAAICTDADWDSCIYEVFSDSAYDLLGGWVLSEFGYFDPSR